MDNKKPVAPVGSLENPLGPSPQEAASKWREKIDPSKHNVEKIMQDVESLLPILDAVDKLGNHTTSMMMAVNLMKKRKAEDLKVIALVDRLRPSLSLKEDLDIYVSDRCKEILDNLEAGHYNQKKLPLLP